MNPGVLVVALGVLGMATAFGAQTTEAPGGGASACSTNKFNKKIEKPITAVQKARDAKNWQEMLAKVQEAAAVDVEKSDFDNFWIHELGGVAYANLKQYPEAVRELGAALEDRK